MVLSNELALDRMILNGKPIKFRRVSREVQESVMMEIH